MGNDDHRYRQLGPNEFDLTGVFVKGDVEPFARQGSQKPFSKPMKKSKVVETLGQGCTYKTSCWGQNLPQGLNDRDLPQHRLIKQTSYHVTIQTVISNWAFELAFHSMIESSSNEKFQSSVILPDLTT